MVVGRAMEVTHRKCVVFRLTLSETDAEEGEEQAGDKEVTHSWRAGVQCGSPDGAEGRTLDSQESSGRRAWFPHPNFGFDGHLLWAPISHFVSEEESLLSTCHWWKSDKHFPFCPSC